MMTPKAFPAKAAFVIANPKSKLLDQLREVMRVKHYSLRTEEAYGQWVRRFLKFHRDVAGAWRHPRELGATDVVAFLNHLAKESVDRMFEPAHAGCHGENESGHRPGTTANVFCALATLSLCVEFGVVAFVF